jgi:Tol biopolymer transport system component
MLVIVASATLGIAPSAASGPSHSASEPQGKIAYSSRFWPKDDRVVDNWELFVKTLDGGDSVRLTRNPRCSEVWPSWSRSGRWLAFGCGWGPSAGIYVVDDRGSARRSVVTLPNGRVNGTAWSPDERKIAFGARGIWVVNADGTGLRRLTGGRDSSPTWSRDGRSIAYHHERRPDLSTGDVFTEVLLMRANGTGHHRIAKRASSPAWSPDGRRIAFLRGVDIWMMNPDGRRQRRLPCCRPDGVAAVAWSPNSRYLAYDSGGVYVTPVEGKSRRRVASGLELLGLGWGPN